MKKMMEEILIKEAQRKIAILEHNQKKMETSTEKTINISMQYKRVVLYDRSHQHYIRQSDWDKVAKPLIRRDLEKKLLEIEKTRLELLEKLNTLPSETDLVNALDPMRRGILGSYSLYTDEMVRKWVGRINVSDGGRTCTHPFITDRGDCVRSKSEAMIANRLLKRGVPYRYEMPLRTSKGMRVPDFVVLNRRTGKEYIYEHLGLLDDGEYVEDNLEKLREYGELGFTLWVNLVVTCESKRNPFYIGAVDRLIEEYFT